MASRGPVTLSVSCGFTATRSVKQETKLDTVMTPKTKPSNDKKRLTRPLGTYTKPKCSLQTQRHYFYPTGEDHFRRNTDASSLENWLETYEPMIMQNIRHRRTNSDRRLRQIDKVFQLIRTAPPRNTTPTMAPRQCTLILTTRPINTYFLPHRITSPTPTSETTTTTARKTSTSNNPTTRSTQPP
ncbi:hypothetical protein IV203_015211 [Nitzschia inconspicua]|uniref:Uncharacterized protein n=1 Tax=Nitzschia inconspicua TaxID=303405 RepID=A0A9K3LAQ9_9STRA|nr:hypothetical protein IV203_015211 [Nitzschia inconspicua]